MRSLILTLVVSVFVVGCGTSITATDRVVMPDQIENWQSFAWKAETSPGGDSNIAAANLSIRTAVEERLRELGYRKVSKKDADFILSHSIFAHFESEKFSKLEERAIRDDSIIHRGASNNMDGIEHQQGEGFLVLVMNRPDGKLAWEGRVEAALTYQGQGAKKVDTAVRKLLANFPKRSN